MPCEQRDEQYGCDEPVEGDPALASVERAVTLVVDVVEFVDEEAVDDHHQHSAEVNQLQHVSEQPTKRSSNFHGTCFLN